MIFSSIVKLGHPISPMWIKFSIYSLSINVSSNILNVPLVPQKSSTWVIFLARLVSGSKNIEAMHDWSRPKTIKILCGFLGLTCYYRNFVQNYGNIATPLTALLKNNSFTWTPTTDLAFQALKATMCTTQILALPNFTKTFVLERDASERGIGAVLMQVGRPLVFTNKQFSDRHLGQ